MAHISKYKVHQWFILWTTKMLANIYKMRGLLFEVIKCLICNSPWVRRGWKGCAIAFGVWVNAMAPSYYLDEKFMCYFWLTAIITVTVACLFIFVFMSNKIKKPSILSQKVQLISGAIFYWQSENRHKSTLK